MLADFGVSAPPQVYDAQVTTILGLLTPKRGSLDDLPAPPVGAEEGWPRGNGTAYADARPRVQWRQSAQDLERHIHLAPLKNIAEVQQQ